MAQLQDRMRGMLAKAGIPSKEIQVYGRQIVITAWSHAAAHKWETLLATFADVRGIVESVDVNKAQTGRRLVEGHKVWRVFAAV